MQMKSNVLTFQTHDLALFCYSVRDVVVSYGGRDHILWDKGFAPERKATDDGRFPNVRFGPYKAFSGELQAAWTTQDGRRHACSINLAEVFVGREVLHGVLPGPLHAPMPISGGEPVILVEIEGGTLNVYMDVMLQLALPNGSPSVRKEIRQKTLAFSVSP